MEKYLTVILGLIVCSASLGSHGYYPVPRCYAPPTYNTCYNCPDYCKPKWMTKVTSYYTTYWDPYTNSIVHPLVVVEPAEFLDIH